MSAMPRKAANPWPARLRTLESVHSDLTQPKLARDVLGVSIRTYHAWLYGERQPDGPAAQLILCLLKQAK